MSEPSASELERLIAVDDDSDRPRIRLVAVTLQLDVVADDGVDLQPLQAPAIVVPAKLWPPDLDAVLADLQARFDAEQR